MAGISNNEINKNAPCYLDVTETASTEADLEAAQYAKLLGLQDEIVMAHEGNSHVSHEQMTNQERERFAAAAGKVLAHVAA